MNVLALYDIHGNLDALEAVLADPRAAGADAIVVGGDIVPGAFSKECLSLLRGHELPVHWVRGNGEREAAEASASGVDAEHVSPDDPARFTAALTASALGAELCSWLGTLPTTVELDGVLYCHASPRSDEEMLTRISPAERWASAVTPINRTSASSAPCASSTPAASACRTRATRPRGGRGSPMRRPSCGTRRTTAPPPAAACSPPAGRIRTRSTAG